MPKSNSVHHGGRVGKAASKLAGKSTDKKVKSLAAKTLVNHQIKCHK